MSCRVLLFFGISYNQMLFEQIFLMCLAYPEFLFNDC